MKFRVSHEDFADAVAWVARSLPQRPAVPVLGGVLLTADDRGLTVSGYDYEVSNQVTTAAEIVEEGTALVSGRLLAEITRALPAKPVDVTVDGTKVGLVCGAAKFTLPVMPVEDYPQLPTLPQHTGTIASEVFTEAVNQVAVAAGKDDMLPMMTGIRVEIDGSEVVMAATDRFRLAVRKIAWTPLSPDVSAQVLIPAKTLSEAAKTFTTGPSVDLALGGSNQVGAEGLLGLQAQDRQSTARLLDAKFPDFRHILPSSHKAIATINTAALTEGIKRVQLVSERGAQVRLEFSEGLVVLTAGGDDTGRAEEEIPVDFIGTPLTIAFNPGYLIDGLKAFRASTLTMAFTIPSRPAVLRAASPDGDNWEADSEGNYAAPDCDYLYLLMPVRIPG